LHPDSDQEAQEIANRNKVTIDMGREPKNSELREIRFGLIAIMKGFISQEDLVKALGLQVLQEVEHGVHRAIGKLLMDQGIMSTDQVEEALRHISSNPIANTEHRKAVIELKRELVQKKALWGILPLCCFCKKIRDDAGHWEEADVYIHKHTQAQISHSLCPECLREHYPEVYEKRENR
jgi:hypothetical protein